MPVKELKAFDKVFLQPGEETEVSFELDLKDIAYYNVLLNDWVTEPCKYEFMLASSSADIRLTETVYVNSEIPYTTGESRDGMIG